MPLTSPAPHRGYKVIHRRLLLTLLLLALTPLAALGLFCLDRINTIYNEKISAGLEAVTSSKHRALTPLLWSGWPRSKLWPLPIPMRN